MTVRSESRVRRRLSPDARRAELIDAAIRVLDRDGLEHTRVEDITAEARTAKGNFYRYFEGFEDLLVAVRAHVLDTYRAGLTSRLTRWPPSDWWRLLDDEVELFVRDLASRSKLHAAAFHGPAAIAAPIDPTQSAPAMVANVLRLGIDAGSFRDVDVEPTSSLIFHVLHGAADDIIAGADERRTIAAAKHVVRAALSRAADSP